MTDGTYITTEYFNTFLTNLLNVQYPVGKYVYSETEVDMSTLIKTCYGVSTTWTQETDVFLLCAGSTYSAGSTGGSADAIVVSHNHTFSGNSNTTSSTDSHSHDITTTSIKGVIYNVGNREGGWALSTDGTVFTNSNRSTWGFDGGASVGYSDQVNLNATHNHSCGSAGSHTHTVTPTGSISTVGNSGTGKNMPPYKAIYVYRRTS